jgi:hypothetical protein
MGDARILTASFIRPPSSLDGDGGAVVRGADGGRPEAAVDESAALHDEALLGGVLVGHPLGAPQALGGGAGAGVQGPTAQEEEEEAEAEAEEEAEEEAEKREEEECIRKEENNHRQKKEEKK